MKLNARMDERPIGKWLVSDNTVYELMDQEGRGGETHRVNRWWANVVHPVYADVDVDAIARKMAFADEMLRTLKRVTSLLKEQDPIEVGCHCSECDGLPIECCWCEALRVIKEAEGK